MLVEHADETQLAQFSRQHLVHTQESEIQVSKLPLEEQKTRPMVYARIAEKTNQYPLAFEYYSQANAIEKARIQATPKLSFNSGERTALTDSIIAEFSSFPTQTAPVTEDICPIFIVGMPRTGTTLLERIIRGLAGGKTTGENAS